VKSDRILDDAQSAPTKGTLEAHREAILLLRSKRYTWREIAEFLAERGVQTDHTKIYRLINKAKTRTPLVTIPNADAYKKALTQITVSDKQKLMLKAHFQAPNRSITYTELAASAGYDDYVVANRQYGQLGRDLGEAVGFQFVDAETRPGDKFYSSSIGMPNAYTTGDFQLVMHHELAKAVEALHWF
jgi:hypothetical protein